MTISESHTLTPIPPSEMTFGVESTLWENEIVKGLVFKKLVGVQRLTNYRASFNSHFVMLKEVDDIIVMNSHRISRGQNVSYGRYYRTGSSSYSSRTIGDVLFMKQGRPVIYFKYIADPSGVARLAKSARKQILTQLKAAQKDDAAKLKDTSKKQKKNEPMSMKSCPNCKKENQALAKFCNECASPMA